MRRTLALALVAACALPAAGCGSSSKQGPESNDKRGAALACLTKEKRLDARLDGADAIQIGARDTGPRVRFFLTRGEAEGEQFAGKAEGTEQSGSALIYVRGSSDSLLKEVEDCVDSL
jgi:hypothetical protein